MEAPHPISMKGRRQALGVLAVGLLVVAAAVLALEERIRTERAIRRILADDASTAIAAARVLGEFSTSRAAEGLFLGLQHHNLSVRAASATGLARVSPAVLSSCLDRMGDDACAVLPGLLEWLMDHRSPDVRKAIAESLARFACEEERVQIALLGTAENDREEPEVRIAALGALESAGVGLEVLAPALIALEGKGDGVGDRASRMLQQAGFGPDAAR